MARDVRMVERRERLRFALEAREPLRIGGERGRQDLDRDVAIELGIARAIDLAHAAGADGARTSYGPRRMPDRRGMQGRRYFSRALLVCGGDRGLRSAPAR